METGLALRFCQNLQALLFIVYKSRRECFLAHQVDTTTQHLLIAPPSSFLYTLFTHKSDIHRVALGKTILDSGNSKCHSMENGLKGRGG